MLGLVIRYYSEVQSAALTAKTMGHTTGTCIPPLCPIIYWGNKQYIENMEELKSPCGEKNITKEIVDVRKSKQVFRQ